MKAPRTQVRLRPGGNAQAMLTWRVNPYPLPTTFDPDLVYITPPDEYAHLQAVWQGGPVRGGGRTPARTRIHEPTSAGVKVKYRNNSSRLISGNDRNCSYCSRENIFSDTPTTSATPEQTRQNVTEVIHLPSAVPA